MRLWSGRRNIYRAKQDADALKVKGQELLLGAGRLPGDRGVGGAGRQDVDPPSTQAPGLESRLLPRSLRPGGTS